jgi:hypothetical protein
MMILWGVVYVLLNAADYFLTVTGRYFNLTELNPVIDKLPMVEFAVYKFIMTGLVLVIIYILHKNFCYQWIKYVLPGATVAMAIIVMLNSFFLWSAL